MTVPENESNDPDPRRPGESRAGGADAPAADDGELEWIELPDDPEDFDAVAAFKEGGGEGGGEAGAGPRAGSELASAAGSPAAAGSPRVSPKAAGSEPGDADVMAAVIRTFGRDAYRILSGEDEGAGGAGAPASDRGRMMEDLITRIDKELEARRPLGMAPGAGRSLIGTSLEDKRVVFTLGTVQFAVSMASVLEIQQPPRITPIPNLPEWILGVTNLRGDVLSVVDLRSFLGMTSQEYERAGRMMVARSADQEIQVGLVVDRVNGLASFGPEAIDPDCRLFDDRAQRFVDGVVGEKGQDRLLVALNLEALLQSPEMRQFQPV